MSKTTKKTKRDTNGPVARARAIMAKMPKARRKDVLAALEKAGINHYTAMYAYHRWRTAKEAR